MIGEALARMMGSPRVMGLAGTVAALVVWTVPAEADVGHVIRSARTPLISQAFAAVKGHAAEPFARMRHHSSIRAAFAAHRHHLDTFFPRADAQRSR